MTTTLMPLSLNHFMDSFFAPAACRNLPAHGLLQTPRADILEGEKDYIIRLDVPGVNRDDLNIEIEDQTLTVSAERRTEQSEGYQSLRNEHADHAGYRRSFQLGRQVDAGAVRARLEQGVLELTLPKSEQTLPRRIEVQ